MFTKKRKRMDNAISAGSMADIAFLLLIFFMLTSSMIVPNALNLKLPGKSKNNTELKAPPTNIQIKRDGTYWIRGQKVSLKKIETAVRELGRRGRPVSMTITPDPNAPNQYVVAVMDIAWRYHVETIIADVK